MCLEELNIQNNFGSWNGAENFDSLNDNEIKSIKIFARENTMRALENSKLTQKIESVIIDGSQLNQVPNISFYFRKNKN